MCLLGLIGSNQPNEKMITGSVGESLKLDCGEFSSLPSATVTWIKRECGIENSQLSLGDNVVVASVESRSLYFRSLTASHAGCFHCSVTNSGIPLTGSYVLTVNGKFASFSVRNFYKFYFIDSHIVHPHSQIALPPSNVVVNRGETAIFQCITEGR